MKNNILLFVFIPLLLRLPAVHYVSGVAFDARFFPLGDRVLKLGEIYCNEFDCAVAVDLSFSPGVTTNPDGSFTIDTSLSPPNESIGWVLVSMWQEFPYPCFFIETGELAYGFWEYENPYVDVGNVLCPGSYGGNKPIDEILPLDILQNNWYNIGINAGVAE